MYILRSIGWQGQLYVGSTTDLAARLIAHNQGKSPHTAKCRPWRIETYVAFWDEDRAEEF